ncbi:MAG: MBL fold metallo-hydrolase [Kofleriaceae bacterium]|nr:MBL fold metallo-hydrolase [Kofleriaceae bacterium]
MRFTLLAVLFATACSGSSTPTQAPSETAQGKAERLQIGSLEAFALDDGYIVEPNDGKAFVLGHTSEAAEVLAAAGLPSDKIRLDVQVLLVKAGDHVILFDTGAGAFIPTAGHLSKSLALAGVEPSAVTDIFISHTHGDHVGGLVTKAGALAFPSATIHMSAPEWATFRADPDADAKRLVAAIEAKVSAFEPGAQVLPEVKAVATQGHTPGHSSYEVSSGDDKVFYLGDVAHHSVLSVQRPAWSIQFDHDHAAGEAMRQQTLAQLASDHTRVFAVHFPFRGVGHVVAEGQGLVWKPE